MQPFLDVLQRIHKFLILLKFQFCDAMMKNMITTHLLLRRIANISPEVLFAYQNSVLCFKAE